MNETTLILFYFLVIPDIYLSNRTYSFEDLSKFVFDLVDRIKNRFENRNIIDEHMKILKKCELPFPDS